MPVQQQKTSKPVKSKPKTKAAVKVTIAKALKDSAND